jgi:hypothetical protein
MSNTSQDEVHLPLEKELKQELVDLASSTKVVPEIEEGRGTVDSRFGASGALACIGEISRDGGESPASRDRARVSEEPEIVGADARANLRAASRSDAKEEKKQKQRVVVGSEAEENLRAGMLLESNAPPLQSVKEEGYSSSGSSSESMSQNEEEGESSQ